MADTSPNCWQLLECFTQPKRSLKRCKRISPEHVEVRNEVHESLRVDGHEVDDLSYRAVLLGGAVHAEGLPVYGRDQGRAEVHPDNEHLLEILRQQDALEFLSS